MRTISVSVLEYLGKVEDGILVLIGLVHNKVYYEATFFYTEKDMIFTISEELEEVIGDIKTHPEYRQILAELIKKVVPYNELIDSIDSVDFARWVDGPYEDTSENNPEYVPSTQIKEVGE
jgi:hypothetical protein